MSLNKIFFFCLLCIGLNTCWSSEIPYSHATKENNKTMFNEIYNSDLVPDYLFKMQESRIDVNTIVMKYFRFGETKAVVLAKLLQMNIDTKKKSDTSIIAYGIKGNDPLFHKDDDKTLEVLFEFDSSSKLSNIKSRYFRRQ